MELARHILETAAIAQAQTTHATPSPQPFSTAIIVPRALWNGKTPPAARDAMAAENIPQNIIAHILYTRCNITNKTYIASLLNTYPKKVTKFLAEAAVMDIVDS
jgi:hypothetical protein